jgi:hypothetical protein
MHGVAGSSGPRRFFSNVSAGLLGSRTLSKVPE